MTKKEIISKNIGVGLRSLGRQLDIKEPVLEALDENHKEFTEKPYQMLLYWKKGEDKKATYAVFYMALCHPFIARTDLANNICCQWEN